MKNPAYCVGFFCFLNGIIASNEAIQIKSVISRLTSLNLRFASSYLLAMTQSDTLMKMFINNLCLGRADNFRQPLQGSLLDTFHGF